MSDCDLAHLDDQMELHTSMLALRACSSENAADALEPVMRSMLAARARIDQTPNKPMLAATRLAERSGHEILLFDEADSLF